MKLEDLTASLIKHKTVSGIEYAEVDRCIKYIKSYFKDTNLKVKEFCFENDKCVYISNTDDKELDVLFVGHIDVVSGDDTQFTPIIKGNKLYGRGSFDMKGHVAVMMSLFKKNIFDKKLGLLITSDEERGGFNGTYRFLNDLDYRSNIAIVPDAGNNFEIVIEEKGVLQLKVTYYGKKAHSSQPWKGNNSIDKIINLYNKLMEKYPLPKSSYDYKTSINIANINGGNLTNEIPSECYAIFDIRHAVNDKKEDFINYIKNYDSNIKVEVLAKGEPFLTIQDNDYYKQFIEVYKDVVSKRVTYRMFESASDGRFFYSKGIPCILMNAKGNNIHSQGEYVCIDSLYKLYNLYLSYLLSL